MREEEAREVQVEEDEGVDFVWNRVVEEVWVKCGGVDVW